jgi:hypothetical protein
MEARRGGEVMLTCSFSSRKARMVPGMMPRTPPPSMLSTVTMLP